MEDSEDETSVDNFYEIDVAHERALLELKTEILDIVKEQLNRGYAMSREEVDRWLDAISIVAFNKTLQIKTVSAMVHFTTVQLKQLYELGFLAMYVVYNGNREPETIDLRSGTVRKGCVV
jgi:hypothetical protein